MAWVLFLAAAGAIGAVVFMTISDYGGDPDVDRMKDTAQWLAWVLVLAVQASVWFALIPGLVSSLVGAKGAWSRSQTVQVVIIVVLLFAPVLSGLIFGDSHDAQAALTSRMIAFLVVGTFVGSLAVTAIVRTHREITDLPTSSPSSPPLGGVEENAKPSEAIVDRYLELRGRLRYLGGVTAVIVALAVLSTGGQRNTIVAMETARATLAAANAAQLEDLPGTPTAANAEAPKVSVEECETTDADATVTRRDFLLAAAQATARATRFGVELVWSFGLYYSFVLVLVYLPPYLSLIEKGRRLRDERHPPLLPGEADYEARKKVRDEMTSVLQLDASATETLRAATLLLIPLLTSFASTLLGGTELGP